MLNYQQDVPAFHIYFSILMKFAVGDTRLRELVNIGTAKAVLF